MKYYILLVSLLLLLACNKSEIPDHVEKLTDTIDDKKSHIVSSLQKSDSITLYMCYNYALQMHNINMKKVKWVSTSKEVIKQFVPENSDLVCLYDRLQFKVDDHISVLKFRKNIYEIENMAVRRLGEDLLLFLFKYADKGCSIGSSGFHIYNINKKELLFVNCMDYKIQRVPYFSFREISSISKLDSNFIKLFSVYFIDLVPKYKIVENMDDNWHVEGKIGLFYLKEHSLQIDTNTSMQYVEKIMNGNVLFISTVVRKAYLSNNSHNTLINPDCRYWLKHDYKTGSLIDDCE